MKLTWEHTQ
ncbi:hypothetical protein LINPERHAP1_LOCUS34675 [Linum perenne]